MGLKPLNLMYGVGDWCVIKKNLENSINEIIAENLPHVGKEMNVWV